MPQRGLTLSVGAGRPFDLTARSDRAELLDGVAHDPAELAANLRDIRRVNRFFGGASVVLHHLPPLLAAVPAERPATLLDLATGSADIPLAVAQWAEEQGRAVAITASDNSDEILAVAREQIADRPNIALARHDARAVPLPDGSFDVVLCSLSLHHFAPDDAVRVLREMERLARVGWILNDLRRGRLGYAAAWAMAHATTTNRLTRHDAPLSVRRAYTAAELRALIRCAGIRDSVVTEHAWFRMAAVGQGGQAGRRADEDAGLHPRPLSPPRERGDEGAGTKPPLPRTGEGVGGEGGEGRPPIANRQSPSPQDHP